MYRLLLLLLVSKTAIAACKDGLVFFPTPGAVIPPNSKFVLQGFGQEQKRVLQLVGSNALSLVADDDVVPLSVQSAWTTARGRVAVRLTPTRMLKPKRDYRLSGLGVVELLNAGGAAVAKWVSSSQSDTVAPKLRVKPAVSEGSASDSADGMSRSLRIHADLEEPSPAYFVVNVSRVRGEQKQQQYFIPFDGNGVTVADNACFGPFEFEKGVTYRFALSILDAAGNKSREAPVLVSRVP